MLSAWSSKFMGFTVKNFSRFVVLFGDNMHIVENLRCIIYSMLDSDGYCLAFLISHHLLQEWIFRYLVLAYRFIFHFAMSNLPNCC